MFTSIAPSGLTGTYVTSIWLFEGESAAPRAELRLPTGEVELMFNVGEDRSWVSDDVTRRQTYPDAVVAGPYQRAYMLGTAKQSHVVGVVFRPGGARPVVDVPLHELRERHVALEDLWGRAANRLHEQLLAAPDVATRLRMVESALHERLTHATHVAHPLAAVATAHLSGAPARHGVSHLGERLGCTPRRMEQVFRADVGLSPKAYQRLQRFRSTLTDIDDVTQLGWSAFALKHGYYDQAHLIREFRAHCGIAPTAYLQRRGDQLNHVPLPA